MKIKTILVSFISFTVLLLCSAFLIYLQMQTIKGLNLDVLEDKLFSEDTKILSWSLKNINLENLDRSALPSSWGEILIVDNGTLTITSSTSKDHIGMSLIKIPELLDQAAPVLDAIKKAGDTTVRTKEYMIALSPLQENRTLIGFKPKSWERGLISDQGSQIQQSTRSAANTLIFYLAGGLIFAVIISVVIAFIVTRPAVAAAKAFESLSLGDFDTELSRTGGKTMVSLSDSFFRLKTSLRFALEKLGSK